MRLTITLAAVLALTACAGAGTPSSPEASSMDPSPSSSSPSPSSSMQPSSVQPTRAPGGVGEELVGTLGADAVEGGCGYLQATDGTRYEVVYPSGWELQLSPLQLTSPEGEIVARGGDEVTLVGAEANDMASICQIGPIFRAAEVVLGE